jgi:hypothetical protein
MATALGAVVVSHTTADEAARKRMKEPVYRISAKDESNSPAKTVGTSAAAPQPTRPVIDPALLAETDSEASATVRRTAGETAIADAANTPPAVATLETASVAPDRPQHDAPKTVKDPQLLLALDDAARCLENIEQNVKDYTCVFIKRENVDGVIVGPDYIQAKVRHAVVKNGKVVTPFSVYMRFVKPTEKRGREVLYLDGLNSNKVLVREAGWKGKLAGAVWLARDSSLLMSENRHEVNEVGILNLTHRILERGHARDGNVAGVDYKATYGGGAELNKRPCRYLDINFTTRNRQNDASQIRVMFDEELNVPIRYVAYGWPSSPGSRAPLLEEYTYVNLEINKGLTDADFSPENDKYSFR